MFKLNSFTVLPTTPEKLKPLLEIASNLWFSWNWDAIQLFEKLDPIAWQESKKNPLKMLCSITQDKLEEISENDEFIAELDSVYASFRRYLKSKTWFEDNYGEMKKGTVAYFSCEFGLHESLPIYSGGLGVLAGDHLKSASDLGVPLVAVGFLYRQGYFRQGLDSEGMQQEFYPENSWFNMPVSIVKDDNEKPLLLSMQIGADKVFYQVWKVKVGRISLYLMDTNVDKNEPKHKDITKRLYDADRDMRLRQEILLGIGGVRTLRKLGYRPTAYHINEGHSAFLILERLRILMETRDLSFKEAKEIVWASNIFTTHTPVPAGNEHFARNLIEKYLSSWVGTNLKINFDEFWELGVKKSNEKDKDDEFCLTVLALKYSSFANGVAKLHGEVSRNMWEYLYPNLPNREVPIGHITNGVHSTTWISKSLEKLLARYHHTSYVREVADFNIWKIVDEIPNQTLWKQHHRRKVALIDYARERLRFQLKRRGANADEINKVKTILDPDALTIGFARRFAPYKRGALLFEDLERLEKIITNPEMPVQFIFAGKAHPADINGKAIIQDIIKTSADSPALTKKIVFLEDYDIDMAKYLVQGVDVWLNTPIRPLEASGTSGMKAAMNGAPNLSILDGWWDEAFDHSHGWAIGHGENYTDKEHQNKIESNLMYRLIEKEVAPLYYTRDEDDDLPHGWIEMMKKTIKSCGQNFNAHRMVIDYIEKYYLKASSFHKKLTDNNCEVARNLATLHEKLSSNLKNVRILDVSTPQKEVVLAGSEVCITSKIKLGSIKPSEIRVEVYHGTLNADDEIIDPERVTMEVSENIEDITTFKTMIPCNYGGRYAYTIRILPGDENLASEFIPGLILWDK